MAELSMEHVPRELTTTASYAAAALHALAREEARDRKPKRLLEAGLATWTQFRGRSGATQLLELLLEDAAVTQPTAFRAPSDVTDQRSRGDGAPEPCHPSADRA